MSQWPKDVAQFNSLAQEPEGLQPDRAQRNFIHLVEEVGETAAQLPRALKGHEVALEHTVDGLIDTIYMAVQTMLSLGLTPAEVDKAWNEVASANLDKAHHCFTCGGTGAIDGNAACERCNGLGRYMLRDASGKIIKPADWAPPDHSYLHAKGH